MTSKNVSAHELKCVLHAYGNVARPFTEQNQIYIQVLVILFLNI